MTTREIRDRRRAQGTARKSEPTTWPDWRAAVAGARMCAALGLIACAQPSRAETYPWCAQIQGSSICAYSTLEQCRAAVSGNGGYCDQNPMDHRDTAGAGTPRRRR